MFKHWYSIGISILVLLTQFNLLECRRSGGASGGRGSSGARTNGGFGGGNPRQGPQNGFNQRPNYPPPQQGGAGFPPHNPNYPPQHGGFNNQRGGFQQPPPPGHFAQGNGLGSASRASSFGTAFLGGAAGVASGLIVYELGKAILTSPRTPFQHNNNNYYFDEKNFPQGSNQLVCSMPMQNVISSQSTTITTTTTTTAPTGDAANSPPSTANNVTQTPEQLFASLQFPDGTRPKTVVWGCKKGVEVCCGMDCCPAPQTQSSMGSGNGASSSSPSGSGIGLILGVLALLWLS